LEDRFLVLMSAAALLSGLLRIATRAGAERPASRITRLTRR
jgi:hypothetical protein